EGALGVQVFGAWAAADHNVGVGAQRRTQVADFVGAPFDECATAVTVVGGGFEQHRAVPASGARDRAWLGILAANPDRDARLLDRRGRERDLVNGDVPAVVAERLARPQPD